MSEPAQAIVLSDEELELLLPALANRHDALLAKRGDAPTLLLYEGDPLPPADTLDGEILRVGQLLFRLEHESKKRWLAANHARKAQANEGGHIP